MAFTSSARVELREYFARQRSELNWQGCLLLYASAEAVLQRDLRERKGKGEWRRLRRRLMRRNRRIEVEEILRIWEQAGRPECKALANAYRSALTFRNWLAHGRHEPRNRRSARRA